MSGSVLFDKPIQEIDIDDLRSLQTRNVAEGLLVEYKSDLPEPKKISHSIASFANTHGGWYIVGIETDEDNVPRAFPGFDSAKHAKPKEHLRDAIIGNINPIPLFESKLLSLDDDKAILLTWVPQSIEMPHITKDGKIYRRNAEGSDPVAETDRYTIDKMYEYGKQFDAYVKHFCRREIEISEAQKQGWLEIYCITYPIGKLWVPDIVYKIEEMQNFLNVQAKLFDVVEVGLKFNHFSTGLDSLIARQASSPSELAHLTLTFQIFGNGNAKMAIPFQYVDSADSLSRIMYESSESLKKLKSMVGENINLYRILDGWKNFTSWLILLQKYVDILKKIGWEDYFLVKFHLAQAWRHILFFDSKIYGINLDRFGIPVCSRNDIDIPDRLERNYFEEKISDKTFDIVPLSGFIMGSLGCSPMLLSEMIEDWIEYLKRLDKLQKAGI